MICMNMGIKSIEENWKVIESLYLDNTNRLSYNTLNIEKTREN